MQDEREREKKMENGKLLSEKYIHKIAMNENNRSQPTPFFHKMNKSITNSHFLRVQ